jgi:hypothetical protein
MSAFTGTTGVGRWSFLPPSGQAKGTNAAEPNPIPILDWRHNMPDPNDDVDPLDLLSEVVIRPRDRPGLEALVGRVWDTRELARDFIVTGLIFPYIVVRRKADDVVGTLLMQNQPRFYFHFCPQPEEK